MLDDLLHRIKPFVKHFICTVRWSFRAGETHGRSLFVTALRRYSPLTLAGQTQLLTTRLSTWFAAFSIYAPGTASLQLQARRTFKDWNWELCWRQTVSRRSFPLKVGPSASSTRDWWLLKASTSPLACWETARGCTTVHRQGGRSSSSLPLRSTTHAVQRASYCRPRSSHA